MNIKKEIYHWEHEGAKAHRAYLLVGYMTETLANYKMLADIARRDFPMLNLTDEQITIGRVTQSRYVKGFALITFELPEGVTNPEYTVSTADLEFYW